MSITSIYVAAGHTIAGAEKFEFIRIDAGVTVTLEPGETPEAAAKRVQPDIRKILEVAFLAQARKGQPPAGRATSGGGAPAESSASTSRTALPTRSGQPPPPTEFKPAGGW